MNKNKFFLIISSITFILISIYTIININLDFNLNGNNNITINFNTKYIEEGYKAKIFNKDLTSNVKVSSNLDINKIGSYKINYSLNIIGFKYNKVRKINVIDREKPVIKLNGDEVVYLYKGDVYIDKGAHAEDNYDGDISNKILIENNINNKKIGEYKVKYVIKDSSGNENSITRKVIVTTSKNTNINNPMIKYITDNNYDISFGYYNLVTGNSYLYNEDKVYFAASLIKILEALYLYDNNLINDELKPYVKKTITVSDNDAHHYLQSVIGKKNLREYGKSLGASHALLGGSCCGETTVNDQLVFLKKLYEITNNKNDELKSWFMNDYVNNIKFDNDIPVMHKYGLYDEVYHNVGIVFDKEPYIVIILTGIPNGYENIVNNLSKIIYDYHLSI